MRRPSLWLVGVVALALLGCAHAQAQSSPVSRHGALPAHPETAQGRTGESQSDDARAGAAAAVWEVAGGYGFLAAPYSRWGRWVGSTGTRLRRGLWVVAEVSGWRLRTAYFDYAWREFLGGVRYERRYGRVTPFARLLSGVDRFSGIDVGVRSLEELREGRPGLPELTYSAASSWVVQAGIGVDVRLGSRAAVRLTADYGSLTPRPLRVWRITPSLVLAIRR